MKRFASFLVWIAVISACGSKHSKGPHTTFPDDGDTTQVDDRRGELPRNPTDPTPDPFPDPGRPVETNTEEFSFDFEGEVLSGKLTVDRSWHPTLGNIELLTLPKVISADLKVLWTSLNLSFIYTSENGLKCPDFRILDRVESFGDMLRFEAGYFELNWLTEETQLGQRLLQAAKDSQLARSNSVENFKILTTNVVSGLKTGEKKYADYVNNGNYDALRTVNSLLQGNQSGLINSQVCDLAQSKTYFAKTSSNDRQIPINATLKFER